MDDVKMARVPARCDVHWPEGFAVRRPDASDAATLTALDHEDMSPLEIADLEYPDSVRRYFEYVHEDADEPMSLSASSVVSLDNRVIAFCLFVAQPGVEGHLYNVHVARACRRKGIATAMILHGLSVLADACKIVTLDGVAPDDDAHVLYRKLGFREVVARDRS